MNASREDTELARLAERVTELELFRDVARALDDDDAPVADVIETVRTRLLAALRHPRRAAAWIALEDVDFGAITVGVPSQTGLVRVSAVGLAGRLEVGAVDEGAAPPPFGPDEARMLDAVADQLGGWLRRRKAALAAARVRLEVDRRAGVRQALLDTYGRVLIGPDGADSAELVLDSVLRTVPGARTGSILVRTDHGAFRYAAVRGYDAERLGALALPPHLVLFGRDWHDDAPFFVDDLATVNAALGDDPVARTIADVSAAAGAAQALVAPVAADGALLAAISVERGAADEAFGPDAPELLRLYARSVGALFLRAERAAHADLLARAVDAASDAIAVVDVPRRSRRPVFRVANPAMARLLGVDRDELARWDPRASLGPATLAHGFRALRKAVRTDEPVRFEVALRRPSGPRIWVEVLLSRLEQDAERVRVLVALRDVTTLRSQLFELQRLNDDLQARLSEAATLEAIDAAITGGGDRRSTLRRAATAVAARPGVATITIYGVGLAPDGASEARMTAVASAPGPASDDEPSAGARRVARERRAVEAADGGAWHPAGDGAGYRAWPLMSKGTLVGVMEALLEPGFVPDGAWTRFSSVVANEVAIAMENAATLDGLRRAAEAYADLAEFSGRIEELDDAEELVDHGVRSLMHTFGLDAAVQFQRRGDHLVPRRRWGLFADPVRSPPTGLVMGEGAAGQAALTGEAVYVEEYRTWRHAAQQSAYADVRTVLGLPVRTDGRVEQAIALAAVGRPVTLRADQVTIAKAFVRRLERALERSAAQHQIEATREEAFRALGLALEYRDYETRGHTDRVVALARRLGQRVGLDDAELEALAWGAYLHDLGKIAIADAVLLKPGRLTAAEYAEVKRHAVIGHEMSLDLPFLPSASREVVRSHHERWDGTGYPDGLAGEAIPRLARLFALADVYDALVSERPYKDAWRAADARAELAAHAGTQFDPRATAAMLALLEEEADEDARQANRSLER
jgi:PAS domain S-box-containing protein